MSRRSSIGRYFMSRYTNKYDYSYFTEYNSSGASHYYYYYISAISGWTSYSTLVIRE